MTYEVYMKANTPTIIRNIIADYLWNDTDPKQHIQKLTEYEQEYNSAFVNSKRFYEDITSEWNLCICKKGFLKIKLQQCANDCINPSYSSINQYIKKEIGTTNIDTFDKLYNAIKHLKIA